MARVAPADLVVGKYYKVKMNVGKFVIAIFDGKKESLLYFWHPLWTKELETFKILKGIMVDVRFTEIFEVNQADISFAELRAFLASKNDEVAVLKENSPFETNKEIVIAEMAVTGIENLMTSLYPDMAGGRRRKSRKSRKSRKGWFWGTRGCAHPPRKSRRSRPTKN